MKILIVFLIVVLIVVIFYYIKNNYKDRENFESKTSKNIRRLIDKLNILNKKMLLGVKKIEYIKVN